MRRKEVTIQGIEQFPNKKDYFLEIGQKIIETTGDKNFRKTNRDSTSGRE